MESGDVLIQLNLKSGVPICDQIVYGFVRLKAVGVLKSGDQLPSVRQLAIELSVNPNTVQKAYQILESSGVVYTVKGRGSFISDDEIADTAIMRSAKKDFAAAVKAASELGLTETDMTAIIAETLEAAEEND